MAKVLSVGKAVLMPRRGESPHFNDQPRVGQDANAANA